MESLYHHLFPPPFFVMTLRHERHSSDLIFYVETVNYKFQPCLIQYTTIVTRTAIGSPHTNPVFEQVLCP